MTKIRRFMVEFIDLFLILFVGWNLRLHFSSKSIIWLGIIYWLLKDCFFTKGSIGKQLFNLRIPISTAKKENLYKKLIFRNFIDILFLLLSFICCLFFYWSLSDIYYKESLEVNNENESISGTNKASYFFCTIVIFLLLIFEPWNYYSIRMICSIVIGVLCSIIYDKFMKSLKYGLQYF